MPELNVATEGGPPQASTRPEYIPEKSPQPLARNFEQRVKQLGVVSLKPSDNQINQLAERFRADSPDSSEDPQEMARNAFENMRSLIQDRAASQKAVEQARKDALSSPRSEFRGKVKALRETEKRRDETNSSLKDFSNDFKDAGIMVEPSQQLTGLMDEVNKKAYEAGWQVVAGAHRVRETVKGGIEAVKEGGSNLIDLGRRGLGALLERSTGSLKQAQESGQAKFNTVKAGAETKTVGGISKIAEIWKGTKERMTTKAAETWEAASVWVNQRREGIAARVGGIEQGLVERMESARASAAGRIDRFNQSMQVVGEGVRGRVDQINESFRQFASEQVSRVDDLRRQVVERVTSEVSMALEKGKIFLEPAWEGIRRDRETVRERREMMQEKLGILVEGVSDLAIPVIDRILDGGRDLRDNTLGFGARHIEGLRAYGRNVYRGSGEVVSHAWSFSVERWENLRLRANESRARLNIFLEATHGRIGNRFTMLRESTAERARRAGVVLSGVKIEGGKIMKDGVEVSKDVGHWFLEQGSSAREFLRRNEERIGQGIDLLQRYWEVYAVGKWREAKLPDIDVQRRIKLLRGIGAASLDRAARVGSIGTTAGIEGAVLLQRLARDPKGKVALTVVALGLAFALNSELTDGLQSFLSNVDLGNVNLGDINIPEVGVANEVGIDSGVSLGQSPIDLGNVPADTGVSTPSVTEVTPTVSPGETPSIPNGMPQTGTGGLLEVVGTLQGITPGQPLEPQIFQSAGGVNENFYNLYQSAFDQFKDNFLSTAQAIVDNPANYTPDQVDAAREQLAAAGRVGQDPMGSQEWYDNITKATRFWRPA